jgi:aminoglycoside phosphotransferase (APT) family kinase protein
VTAVVRPPGLDLDRLGPWFAAAVPGAGERLTAELIAGGRSNLTYRVTDQHGSTWVVRRPPLGHVLETAHDMGREYRVMAALQGTDVPVPPTVAACADDAVVGAPFYVMEYVAGVPYRHAAQLLPLGPQRTRVISERLVDTLAALHRVDPAAVGLAGFGRPEGFLARQVSRWRRQLDASRTRDLPAADELHRLLAADVPTASAAGIVHGDYRLDNVLVDEDDRLVAVIDWEMATLGDPLTDLALTVVYQRLAAQSAPTVADAAAAPGFLTEQQVVERYARHTDRDMARFGFYLGLASFKLAAILEGIHFRYLQGKTVGPGFEHVGHSVALLLDTGLSALTDRY